MPSTNGIDKWHPVDDMYPSVNETPMKKAIHRTVASLRNKNGRILRANVSSWICSAVLGASLVCALPFPAAMAQSGSRTPPAQGKQPPAQTKRNDGANRKLSEAERRQERAREIFADAANAQNNGAYGVAIDLWKKLIKEYSADPLASSARHFLGVCYQEQETPDYKNAIASFRKALEDPNLKEREESMINLGWSLFQLGTADGEANKELLSESAKVLANYLAKYPDSSFADKAIFYAGEAEARIGNLERAISFYNQLAQSKTLTQSPIRPDAMFALGFSYEEAKQPKLAAESYEAFVTAYPKHALVTDVQVRLAELALQSNKPDAAVAIFSKVVATPEFKSSPVADYVYYRYAFALAKTGKFAESAKAYETLSELFPKSQYAGNASLATGQTLMRDKKYDEARRAFEKLLPAKDERAAEAAHWLCQIAILQNRAPDAIPIAKDAMDWASKWPANAVSPSAKNTLPLLKMDLADGLYATTAGRAEARKLYEQIAVETMDLPISPRATYNAAFAALQAGEHAEAQRWSEAFAKRYAKDDLAADVAYVRAESLLQLGQHESAATAFEQLIQSASDHPSAASWELRLATALYLSGQYDKTIAQAGKTIQRNSDVASNAEAYYLQGASFLKSRKTAEAIRSLDASRNANKEWAQADEVLLLLSQAHDANEDKEAARKTLEQLLRDYPNSRFKQQAEFRLGQLSALAQKFDEAVAWYDRVLAQATDPALLDYVRYDKAYVLIQKNQVREAARLLDTVIASGRNATLQREAKIARAICFRKDDHPSDAVTILEELLKGELSDESRAKVLYELGLSLSSSDRPEQAVKAFDQIVSKYPKYPLIDRVYFERAWAYKALGDTDKSNASFLWITENFPNSPLAAESYFHVGQAEFENAKFDRAVKAYTVAATRSPSPELQEKSLYKLGLSFFQQQDFASAAQQFSKQLTSFPKGELQVDARLMVAECSMKQQQFPAAWSQYEQARKALESAPDPESISSQVRALIYLHGAQTARELKKWNDVTTWIERLQTELPGSNLEPIGKFEKAFALQNLKKNEAAIELYEQVAEEQRNELGARARFMIGEVQFAERNFAKAITEFQKVMFGYGGTQAPEDIKNWQARSAFEAGRCSEITIGDLTGDRRKKAVDASRKFYEFLISNHPDHELAKQANERLVELNKR
ncbi:MAG: tetratricopeptide repeat protein [Planctomycetota bacterium]